MNKIFYILSLSTLINAMACKGEVKNEKAKIENEIKAKTDMDKESVEEKNLVTLSGRVLGYKTDHSACFFVDAEMVKQGITDNLGNKAESSRCIDSAYGKGVLLVFSELDQNSDYPMFPAEDILILIKGYWKTESVENKEDVAVFYVIEYEPFF